MDDIPNYLAYSWEQLQDARAHINRERYPINFAALEEEMVRRRNQNLVIEEGPYERGMQSSALEVSSWPIVGSRSRYGLVLYGWLGGVVTGAIIGHIWFLILVARLRASGANPSGHDDWGFGWIGCLFVSVVVCSVVGLFIGLSRATCD